MIHSRDSDHMATSPKDTKQKAQVEQLFGCVTNGGHLGNGGHIEFCKCQLKLHSSQLNAVRRKTEGIQQ